MVQSAARFIFGEELPMPEPDKAAVTELLKPLMLLWVSRSERKAAREAGKLRFWKDGMLKQLKEVAEGKATTETFKKLKGKLRDSEEDVSAAIVVMKKIRNRLGGGPVARAIDDVLNNEAYGKGSIREAIRVFTEDHMTKSDRKFIASQICREIEALNASLDRLQRLVYE
jgi:hypothetical protein